MPETKENYLIGGMGAAAGCGFTLFQAGYLRGPAGEVCKFGNYNCWHVVTSGRGFVKCGNRTVPLKVGDVFSVMYGCTIQYGPAEGEDWEFIFLRIEGEKAREMTGRIGLSPENPALTGGGERCAELFKAVIRAAREKCRIPEEYALMIFRIVTFFTSALPEKRRSAQELVSDAEKLLEHASESVYNVNDLAGSLHVSRGTLFHAFKEVLKVSPIRYLHEKKLKKCLSLIAENPLLTFGEIAKRARFSDEKYFLRFFRKKTGMTPGEYRKKHLPL